MHRLPARIAAVMIGTILVFVLTVSTSIFWMTRALDRQALDHSSTQLGKAHASLLDRTQSIAVDYAKWDEVVAATERGDIGWIYENFGSEATFGELLQLAIIWGGPLPEEIGWTDDGIEEGRPGLLDPALLGQIERHVAAMPIGVADGTALFAWHKGSLFSLSAARIEIPGDMAAPPGQEDRHARLLVGQRITEDVIAGIAESYLLDGLELVRQEPATVPFLALSGGDGQPVAYLAWTAPRPGMELLGQMSPPLMVATGLIATLATVGMVLIRRNAHHLVTAERRSATAARTDALTGLPNRAAFNEALSAPARAGERAILFLDVNGFKGINDSIGHAAGDRVIAELARRLAGLGGEGRMLARIGGDEFVILLAGADACAETERVARAVETAMAPPFEVMGHELWLQAAMGYAVQGTDLTTGDDLLRQADLAMYEAKRLKGQGPVAFGALIEQAVHDARAIERALRAALEGEEGEFGIAYQPIAAPGGGLSRVEALARWTSPELGSVPPDRFIAVAEQSGLIIRLGRVLLRLILDDLAAHPGLRVSINISPLQLMAPTFVQDLLADLAERGVDPARIEVELTESVVVDDPLLAAERLRELHEAGFSTALDDFGTGYSSIGYLQQMGFNTLKVDRSFVSGFCESPERLALVNAMILLAHALGLRVVCEGVETEQELRMLQEMGCDLAQGYHLDRPLPIDALAARWLDRDRQRNAVA